MSKLVTQLGADESSTTEGMLGQCCIHAESPLELTYVAVVPEVEGLNYEELKKEKRTLQYSLHKYQQTFVQQYGRKVQFLEDRLPVQKEYARYKELKVILEKLEASGATATSSADGGEEEEEQQEKKEVVAAEGVAADEDDDLSAGEGDGDESVSVQGTNAGEESGGVGSEDASGSP